MEERIALQEDKIFELKKGHEYNHEEYERKLKEMEDMQDKKTQEIITDYEKILQTMQQQQDDQSRNRKDVEVKLIEQENKNKAMEDIIKEKDNKIIEMECGS